MNEEKAAAQDDLNNSDPAYDALDINKLSEYHAVIMLEVSLLVDHATRMLARAAPPITVSSRRSVEAACLSIRRVCEYLAVVSVFAHHWDGQAGPNLMAWKPKDLLASVNTLSEHPMPAPISALKFDQPMEMTARSVEVSEIVKLYGQCSNLIHVGSPNRILQGAMPAYDLARMLTVVSQLARLTKAHVLMLPGIKRVLIWHGDRRRTILGEAPDGALLDAPNLPNIHLGLYD